MVLQIQYPHPLDTEDKQHHLLRIRMYVMLHNAASVYKHFALVFLPLLLLVILPLLMPKVDAINTVYNVKQIHSGQTYLEKSQERITSRQKNAGSKHINQEQGLKAHSKNVAAPKKDPHKHNTEHIITIKEQTGTEATLPCNVSALPGDHNATLMWKKVNQDSEVDLSSIDFLYIAKNSTANTREETLTPDKRFLAEYDEKEKMWNLHIRYTSDSDAGLYLCQGYSSANKILTVKVMLELITSFAEIMGEFIRCVNDKKPLRLSCVLHNSLEPPEYIFWYHDNRVINYDLGDGAHVREGDKGSELIFAKPNSSIAGNYTCVPSNARQASVYVNFNKDLPSTCDIPGADNGGTGKKSHSQGDHIVNMLVLISTFHLCR